MSKRWNPQRVFAHTFDRIGGEREVVDKAKRERFSDFSPATFPGRRIEYGHPDTMTRIAG
jgi:hypothetical protein